MGYFVPELGYQEYYLAKKHAAMGHEVYVIASDRLYPFPNIENMLKEAGIKNTSRKRDVGLSTLEGIKVYRLKSYFEYADFILCFGLKGVLEKIKPDVVIAHESRQGLTALGAWYKKRFGYKLIVDQHDFHHKIPGHPKYKKILRYLDYFLFRKFLVNYSFGKADRIVAVTDETKDFLVRVHRLDPKNVLMIPLGVDTDSFKFDKIGRIQIRKKFNIKDNDVVFTFSGTIVRRKGLELLINAFSELKEKNTKLMIIGTGDSLYMQELKSLAKSNGIDDRCLFTGFIKKNRIKKFFSASDVGVWPGNNSVSIIEAMACRLPIVMVDLQLTHLVGYGNGLYFPMHDKESLKKCLRFMAVNRNKRIEMGKAGFNAVIKNYGYEKIAEEFIKISK